MEKIEVTGKTVEEALINAALQLETSSDNLEYEVIEKGSNGLFGFINSKPAKILVSKKQEENAEIIEEITVEETEEVKPEKVVDKGAVEDKIRKFLNDIFKTMDLEVTIEISFNDDESIDINLIGGDMGVLIGKRGQTLDSLHYLRSLVANKEGGKYFRVKLDTENYRERRKATLESLAKNIAYKVKRTRRPVSLEPMNPYERRIIHSALQNDKYVRNMRETIAAIATGMGSGIGIIRISGEEAFSVIDKIFVPKKSKKKMSEVKSHTIHYGNIVFNNEIVDEVLVMVMAAPNTYTKEDTIEINCHGGSFVMKKVLEAVLKSGARPAEPGEFTKRAFLNGRIDLSQAEAVIDIINSKNKYALKNSINLLNGKLSEQISNLRAEIIHNVAFIEAALDDPEHISLDNFGDKLENYVDKWVKTAEKLLITVDNGKLFTQGINTVILGKPNAGKSSILNILSGRERAIVTDIEGTTRDIIEEQINLNGITLNLIDTAGIRNTEDIVENIGVNKAKATAEDADLIMYVVDSSRKLDENDYEILKLIKNNKAVVLLNKSDLEPVITVDKMKELTNNRVFLVSAKENTGLEELTDYIVDMFTEGKIDFNDEVYISNERDKAALDNALESLRLVKRSINEGMPEDFYTIDLLNAYEELGKIIGESVEDDLVNEIFSKFCMGK